jgi:hypothetical protein
VSELLAAPPLARPFAFVFPGHPLRADVERFWALLDASPPTAEEGERRVRSVLRLYPGTRQLKWLNVSVQERGAGGFQSRTYHYRTRKRRLTVYEPFEDPLLPCLPSLADEADDVLQYVPRHRFTFRAGNEIGKAVRRSELEAGWLRLRAVWEAASRSRVGFAVAEPRRVDRDRGVFYQVALPGFDLAELIDARNASTLLRRAGAVHAELQSLAVPDLPWWHTADLVPQLREHAELVTLFRPDAAAVVEDALALLLATTPAGGPRTFCHGDLRCGHLLEHEGLWSVVDFDGCRIGDPCQDVARLLAFLKRDVQYLRERFAAPDGGHEELDDAVEAFLAGHAERARVPLEPARLTWYLLAHELHFLARMFKRDLYDSVAFERGLERARGHGERLRERLGRRRRP